jgi:hypothetical protein
MGGQPALQGLGREVDIRVAEENPLAARALQSPLHGMDLSQPVCGELLDVDHLEPRLLLLERMAGSNVRASSRAGMSIDTRGHRAGAGASRGH